jgi:hypothetical protein
MGHPKRIAIDAGGNLYVTDSNTIKKITLGAASSVETIAGSDNYYAPFKDGPANEATFISPEGLAFGGDGCLYVADTGSNRIRKITLPTEGWGSNEWPNPATTTAATTAATTAVATSAVPAAAPPGASMFASATHAASSGFPRRNSRKTRSSRKSRGSRKNRSGRKTRRSRRETM